MTRSFRNEPVRILWAKSHADPCKQSQSVVIPSLYKDSLIWIHSVSFTTTFNFFGGFSIFFSPHEIVLLKNLSIKKLTSNTIYCSARHQRTKFLMLNVSFLQPQVLSFTSILIELSFFSLACLDLTQCCLVLFLGNLALVLFYAYFQSDSIC